MRLCTPEIYSMSNNAHVVQVGRASVDHPILAKWPYSAEAITDGLGAPNVTRPVFVLSTQTNGSDLLGEAVAAYASLSILFDKINPQLSVALEDDAFTMYELMGTMPNTKYSAANPEYNVRSTAGSLRSCCHHFYCCCLVIVVVVVALPLCPVRQSTRQSQCCRHCISVAGIR